MPRIKSKKKETDGVDNSATLENDVPDPALLTATPTFAGRLNLSSYAFSPRASPSPLKPQLLSSPSPRSSPRISTPASESATALPPPTQTATSTPSPSKRKRSDSVFASPSASTSDKQNKKKKKKIAPAPPQAYAHLPPLPDVLAPSLIALFIGLNPGIRTSLDSHAYSHPTNLFWRLLHSSGCTSRLLLPSEDRTLPENWQFGNTNIVERPTRNGGEVTKKEMDAGVGVLEEKVRRWRPEAVVLVGKGIWESVWRVRYGRGITKAQFKYGWQDERENFGKVEKGKGEGEEEGWEGAKVFVATSSSGLAASLRPREKERIWTELGLWVERRRAERGDVVDGGGVVVKDEKEGMVAED